ncbi:MAG: NAD(P)/FAD-dependent oxidoreductase [Acidimicrobiales bacterium]|nr:NAD(P)/FAD-dependent oxidoreductase [Acidimicrobiales bacterium]
MSDAGRPPGGWQPFDDDDEAAIAAALAEASVPALLCSLVHITGDPSWIRGSRRPRMASPASVHGGMPDDELAAARAEALPAVMGYRQGGYQVAELSIELVEEMMDFLAATPVSRSVRDLFHFDLQFDGVDPGAITWGDDIDAAVKADSPVVVIGAGMAGIQAGIRLGQAGLPFTIIEKNAGPGGTWWENRYPGARVDVPSRQYCYAFEPSDHWSEFYCQHGELRAYFSRVFDKYELAPHCRFETEVTGAEWDEAAGRWRVATRALTGETGVLDARFVISAVGSLNIPKMPDIEGIDTFAGPSFHSTRWPEGFDHRGTRFALLGAGASGFQIAPAIADEVEHLDIFQRTAQWIMPNPIYHQKVPPGETWAMRHLPYFGRWVRFMSTYPGVGRGVDDYRIDPEYVDPTGLSINPVNAQRRDGLLGWMRQQLADRADLIEKSTPDYPALGKRILQDDGSWFGCLKRPNVELVRTAIERIEPEGIVTADGTLHPADVICYATGFKHNDFLAFDMIGRDGVSLHEQWGDAPTAYLGITMPNFPNLFLCYGPGTNLAHSAGLFFHAEYQTMHAMDAIHQVLAADAKAIEVRQEVHDAYADDLVENISALVWAHPTIQHSHYKSPSGRVYTLSPWSVDTYWAMTHRLNADDYVIG